MISSVALIPSDPWSADAMHFHNRISGFYLGSNLWKKGFKSMTLDERNEAANETIDNRLDQLKAAFEKFEERVQSWRIIVPVEYCYETDIFTGQFEYYIGIRKIGSKWRLCHGYKDCADPREDEWKPLQDMSIPTRIEAATYLELLLEEIVKAKEKTVKEIEEATAKVVSIIDRLEHESAE